MITKTQSRKYPLILAEYAFDLACEYGWKPKVTNWREPFIQAIDGRCYGFNEDFVDIGDLPEEDRAVIADGWRRRRMMFLMRLFKLGDITQKVMNI